MKNQNSNTPATSPKKKTFYSVGLILFIPVMAITPFFINNQTLISDNRKPLLSEDITNTNPQDQSSAVSPNNESDSSAEDVTTNGSIPEEQSNTNEENEAVEMIKIGYVKPHTGTLNIRSGASTNDSIVGSLSDGDAIEIISLEDNWYKIKYENTIAYVFASYIMDTEPDLTETVQPNPSHTTSGFYENIVTVTNTESYAVIVNKNNALSSNYVPSDLSVVHVTSVNGTIYLREVAARQIENLVNTAQNEAGLTIYTRSGYRSYQTQADLYQRYVNANGREKADTFSARPGHSEHQTGLAIDVTADSVNNQLSDYFGDTTEGQWIKHNAHRFGFIIRYPQGKENLTGYQYEPWHLRYVGTDIATVIYENDILLEDY